MVKFVAIKINYDDRELPVESKYAVVANRDDYQRILERFENEGKGGHGFHECLNFQIPDEFPVQAYLPPTGIPKDLDEEYVIFSFTYQSDPLVPSAVLGVHGTANLINRDGVSRPGMRRVSGVDKFTYHIEAEPEFVTLFSTPLPYDRRSGRYTPSFKTWGFGLRYIEAKHAANILSDALARGARDLKIGSESYRSFVERGIEVISRIRTNYGLDELSSRKRIVSGSATKSGGGALPDKILGQRGEEFIFRREQEYAVKQGFRREAVSWASQSNPTLPYDIETVRRIPEGHRHHFIEVKSTTLDDLTNIYVSQQQIDYMKAKPDASSFIVLLFGSDGEPQDEWTFSIDELLRDFEFLPIKFKLKPMPSFARR
jgi:Domain of unknown function (DUF3883)